MTPPTFRSEFVVRVPHTDAAGIMFFAKLFEFAHLAYEAFLDAQGMSLPADLHANVLYPIVHAEADYRRSLRLGDRFAVDVSVARVGSRSFALDYRFERAGEETAHARTVHAAVDPESGRTISLPADLRAALSPS